MADDIIKMRSFREYFDHVGYSGVFESEQFFLPI